MQIDNRVDLLFCANIDNPIEMLKARFFYDSGVRVVLKVTVIDLVVGSAHIAGLLKRDSRMSLTGIRIQFNPRDANNLASSSEKKYSRN